MGMIINSIIGAWALLVAIAITFVIMLPFTSNVEAQSSPIISVEDGSVIIGETINLEIVLSEAFNGLAGFDIEVWVRDIGEVVGEVVGGDVDSSFTLAQVTLIEATQEWPKSVRLIGVDLDKTYQAGVINIPLATVEIVGVSRGCVDILIVVYMLTDDFGNEIQVLDNDGTLEVIGVLPIIPTQLNPVQDNNCDGFAEDLNGNGRIDFMDIVLLFIHKDSPEVQNNIELFDRDLDGDVDFNDIVLAFEAMPSEVQV